MKVLHRITGEGSPHIIKFKDSLRMCTGRLPGELLNPKIFSVGNTIALTIRR
jgi:hypothetical protein